MKAVAKVRIICKECKKTFEVLPYIAKHQKFCSIKCKSSFFGKIIRGENHPLYNHNVKPRKCKICDKIFRPYVSNAKKGMGKYCSLNCYWKSLRTGKFVKCFFCGKKFYCHPRKLHKKIRLFCSNKCKMNVLGREHGFKKGNVPWWKLNNVPHPAVVTHKPNKIEKRLISIIDKNNLPFKYVGDGQIWIGSKNPDFISLNEKKIIELFGDFWHTQKVRCFEETENGRKEHFLKYGYKTLIIWEHELVNEKGVLNKIENFVLQ
jgi:very-short-patch-repair endonuclease